MMYFRSLHGSTLAIVLGLVAFTHAADTGKTGSDKSKTSGNTKTPDGKPAAQPEKVKETQGLGSFGKVLPLGQKNIDVKIPSFKDGKPDSLVRAGSMTRVDDSHMDMEKTDIRLYGETREGDLRVQLPVAVYDMGTQIMTSDVRSRISREDFQLEGDTLVFDTRSRQGKMTGHIHMIIYDAEKLSKKPDTVATPATEKPPSAVEFEGKK